MVEDMANSNISIVPQCALIYDHIFVNADDLPKAISVISHLHDRAIDQ
jgi:hypothetical protein